VSPTQVRGREMPSVHSNLAENRQYDTVASRLKPSQKQQPFVVQVTQYLRRRISHSDRQPTVVNPGDESFLSVSL
jgi:hypothetical protein